MAKAGESIKPRSRKGAPNAPAEVVQFADLKAKGRDAEQPNAEDVEEQGTDVSGLITVMKRRPALVDDGLDRWPQLEAMILEGVNGEPPPVKMSITPAMSEKILTIYNTKNRLISNGWANALTRQYEDGLFIYNGDTIRFSTVPNLFDGQHRLEAAVRSGIPFEAIVVTGLPPEAQITMDTGRKRSAGDQLAILGIPYSTATAATVRWIFSFAAGQAAYHPGNSEIISFFQMYQQEITESVRQIAGLPLSGTSPTLMMALDFVARNVLDHPDRADAMVRVCTTNSADYNLDPIHRTLHNHMVSKAEGAAYGQASQYNNLAYAFNLFMDQKPNKNLKIQAPPPSETYVKLKGFEPATIGLTAEGRLVQSGTFSVADSTPRRQAARTKR
jgi:hypothetical protein